MAEEKKQEASGEEATEEKKQTEEQAPTEEKSEESNDSSEEVEVPEKFKSLVDEIEKMSVLDLSELVKILEKKFGVSASAPTAVAAAPAAEGGEAAAEEKDEFDVELTDAGGNKIAVIKGVRAITEMGLKDAKDLVDGAPNMVKEGVKKEEAEDMKKQLEEAGATVTLK